MKPYYSDEHVTLYHGDCLDVLATLPDASVDAVVTGTVRLDAARPRPRPDDSWRRGRPQGHHGALWLHVAQRYAELSSSGARHGRASACASSSPAGTCSPSAARAPGTASRPPSRTQAAALDQQTGVTTSRIGKPRGAASGDGWGMTATGREYEDQGGASRFFPTFRYEAKAGSDERPSVDGIAHPTVKPLDLMAWLVRLVTPPGGTVLEPFAGSGTTAEACVIEGFSCIAIEREADYLPLIVSRLTKPIQLSILGEATA